MIEAKLPDYAKAIAPGKIEVEASEFYPFWLDALNVEEITQYWLEMCFICMRMDIQWSTEHTDLAPPKGGALVISVKDSSKADDDDHVSKWCQARYPDDPKARAIPRRVANRYFQKVRRALPMGFDDIE